VQFVKQLPHDGIGLREVILVLLYSYLLYSSESHEFPFNRVIPHAWLRSRLPSLTVEDPELFKIGGQGHCLNITQLFSVGNIFKDAM
jgi:hypothetical protein